jgi:NTE family protein
MTDRIKVGLALGAGAARGLAHIGVLEVLEEQGISIDYIAGCSMGAVIGCMFANGISAIKIKDLATDICSKGYRKLFDITFPHIGLIRGDNIDKLVSMLTGDRNIDELKIPFATIAACLEDGKVKIFDSGKTTDAVRASISIPGLFEPVILDGRTYVDGGVLVRVPVDLVRSMGANIVIAVDVGYCGELRSSPKNIIDMMIYSFELQQWEAMRGRRTDADITIAVDTSHINPADFNHVEEIVDKGRAATVAIMEDIKKLLEGAGRSYWTMLTRRIRKMKFKMPFKRKQRL